MVVIEMCLRKHQVKSCFICILYPESLLSGSVQWLSAQVCFEFALHGAATKEKEDLGKVWSPEMGQEDILVLNTTADLLRIKSRVNAES